MSIRKTLIVWLMIALCCISFVSCASANAGSASTADEEERMRNEAGLDPLPPTRMKANGCIYYELDLETIQNLNLAVESCDGLTEIGKFDPNGIASEYMDDGSYRIRRIIRKTKEDYDAKVTVATIAETVYAHPNPQYPNLLVAVVDGEPAVFQWAGFDGNKSLDIRALMKEVYGVTDAEKIRALCVKKIQGIDTGILETTVTDRAELEAFYDAISKLSGVGEEYLPSEAGSYPFYECVVELENGFHIVLSYSPNDNRLTYTGLSFEANDALAEWITAHGDQ